MEVTRSNFKSALPLIREALEECDFLAIDGEFTGLDTIRGKKNPLDTVAERYNRLRRGSHNFQMLQYGICFFTWDASKLKYMARPFSVYLFPRPYKRFQNDIFFTCQSSSLDFLANNKFDFNKVIKEGVSYMPVHDEQYALERLELQLSQYQPSVDMSKKTEPPFIPKVQREVIDKVKAQVAAFMKDGDVATLDLDPCTPFQRKLLYESLESEYPMGLYLESQTLEDTKEKFIRCVKITEAGKGVLHNQKRQEEMDELGDVVGFTNVLKMIQKAGKLVIGHNMMLDVLLTMSQFFASRLPEDVNEFKALVQSVFSKTLDTKLMAESGPFKDKIGSTGLGTLVGLVKEGILEKAEVEAAEGFTIDDDAYHDAGFDAYCTGYVFVSLARTLMPNMPNGRVDLDWSIVKPFYNKINLYGIHDIQYMDVAKPDETPPHRGHVFFVKFPRGWRQSDLENLFSPISPLAHYQSVIWLGDTSAYVVLGRPEKAHEVMKMFVDGVAQPGVYVRPYTDVSQNSQQQRHNSSSTTHNTSQTSAHNASSNRASDQPAPPGTESGSESETPATIQTPKKKRKSDEVTSPVPVKKQKSADVILVNDDDSEDGELSSSDEDEEDVITNATSDGLKKHVAGEKAAKEKKLFDVPDW